MKTALKIAASILLLFNGVGAIYGGVSLILFPDGSGLGMNVVLLEKSPFSDFLIPGIVLVLVNGLGSFVALLYMVINKPKHTTLIIAQGVVLCGWIVIQIIMIRQLNPLHYIMFSTGTLLILCGLIQRKISANQVR